MANIELIGNLGADAKVEERDGRKFVCFNVADTESWTDAQGNRQERTQWVSCTLNGDGGNLLPYLLKGKTVFVRGRLSTRVYSSSVHRCYMAGVNCAVREVELVGGAVREVPRQLADTNGLLHEVFQAYYIDPKTKPMPSALSDTRMRQYRVNKHGFVSLLAPSPDESKVQQPVDPNNDPNAPVW